jgi:uncharacterized iron-regulated membrane protein
MSFRKIIFWLHLITGIAVGIIILIMSVTGVILTYEKQMTAWADKKAYPVHADGAAAPLAPSSLIEHFITAMPDVNPANLTLSSDPAMPAMITIPPSQTFFIDPYTGKVLGSEPHSVRTFFRSMTDWHRWLALSGENRQRGRAVTGAGNLVFLFLAFSGLYLWWPRKWSGVLLRTVIWFRGGLKGRSRDYNWHHVFGFWPLIPLVLVIASAVVISYPWANQLLFRFSGSELQTAPKKKMVKFDPGAGRVPLETAGIDTIFETITKKEASWKTISFQPPTIEDRFVSFSVNRGYGGQPQHRFTYVVEQTSGKIIRTERFADLDPGLRARSWMRFVHTGEYYGILGQTIAGIASFAGVFLVWTGYALTLRRYKDWSQSRRKMQV